jgi:phosphopantetheinyl transferase (holo-ACP synthase)
LRRLFFEKEIDYCLSSPTLSAQRFALRFAAREAFFKALNTQLGAQTPPFLTVCRHMRVELVPTGGRAIVADWQKLLPKGPQKLPPSVLCTFTHTQTIATAIVMLQKES